MSDSDLQTILDELRELRELITAPRPRVDDLVDASYVANRTGLALRTVKEGKAGTDSIPRVRLRSGAGRPLIRYSRAAVDQFVAHLVREATHNHPRQRALRVLARKPKKQRSAA